MGSSWARGRAGKNYTKPYRDKVQHTSSRRREGERIVQLRYGVTPAGSEAPPLCHGHDRHGDSVYGTSFQRNGQHCRAGCELL